MWESKFSFTFFLPATFLKNRKFTEVQSSALLISKFSCRVLEEFAYSWINASEGGKWFSKTTYMQGSS